MGYCSRHDVEWGKYRYESMCPRCRQEEEAADNRRSDEHWAAVERADEAAELEERKVKALEEHNRLLREQLERTPEGRAERARRELAAAKARQEKGSRELRRRYEATLATAEGARDALAAEEGDTEAAEQIGPLDEAIVELRRQGPPGWTAEIDNVVSRAKGVVSRRAAHRLERDQLRAAVARGREELERVSAGLADCPGRQEFLPLLSALDAALRSADPEGPQAEIAEALANVTRKRTALLQRFDGVRNAHVAAATAAEAARSRHASAAAVRAERQGEIRVLRWIPPAVGCSLGLVASWCSGCCGCFQVPIGLAKLTIKDPDAAALAAAGADLVVIALFCLTGLLAGISHGGGKIANIRRGDDTATQLRTAQQGLAGAREEALRLVTDFASAPAFADLQATDGFRSLLPTGHPHR